jgi:ubiquitin carboxyl-terminal hydrolase 25/28
MITSPQPAVKPEQELARLTLISSTNEAEIRRRSTISGRRPTGLGELNGMPLIGPLGPPTTVSTDPTVSQAASSATIADRPKQLEASDKDSEATLVSESIKTENPKPLAQDKENQPPSKINEPGNESAPVELMDLGDDTAVKTESLPEHFEPPTRPPPVPPRPSETDRQRQLIEEVELGAQQDVTEVINNVLFQSECAIKPRSIAPDGEQLDQIKE